MCSPAYRWKSRLDSPLYLILIVLLCFASISVTRAAINEQQLSAHYDATGDNINFRVYSSRATRMELWLYSAGSGVEESGRYPMNFDQGSGVWSLSVPVDTLRYELGITGAVYYGYRAWGPNWQYDSAWSKGGSQGFIADVDAAGNRFNPNKLLLDPYAREISQDPFSGTCADSNLYASGELNRFRDSGRCASKGIVLAPNNDDIGIKPTRAMKDDVIYEVHLRGLTKNDDSLPEHLRGTYAGAASKAGYLASLGVTAVEFLPVQELQNDNNDMAPYSNDGDNYWGYMTLNYFSPDRRYAADKSPGGPTREWKAMVKAFHDVGIKVFVDVVYNHSGESNPWVDSNGQTQYNLLSWRGLDNPTYYSLTDDRQSGLNNNGVNGNYNSRNRIAQNLIIDSLAYWRDTLGVDGFRFDLAPVLGNTCEHGCFNYDKLDGGTALNRISAELAPRPPEGGTGVDLIAEPWAIGGNSYQVGNLPAGWVEWNGYFRERMRKKQNRLNIDTITLEELSRRFAGSPDLYGDDGRGPGYSVNYIVSHDGFTLNDLYVYNTKHNDQPWPYGPSDGGDDENNSWDQGGDRVDQRQAARTGMALMLISAGVPMITGGDEYLRTQYGNNNIHNLDSPASWLDWNFDNSEKMDQYSFTQRLLRFRHDHPALRPLDFYSQLDNNGNGMEQLRWFRPDGTPADSEYMTDPDNHALAWRLDGSELGDSASALYMAYNASEGKVDFTLPWPGLGKRWYHVADTAAWNEGPEAVAESGYESYIGGEGTLYHLHGRAVVVLIAK